MATKSAFAAELKSMPEPFRLPDGSCVRIRAIESSDRAALVAFHRSLSDKTVYLRYFSPVSVQWRTSPKRLAEELCADPEHHCTLVVERRAAGSGLRDIVGLGRLVIPEQDERTADFAVVVRDDYQGMGIGTELLKGLIEQARRAHLLAVTAAILPENLGMLEICKKFGFQLKYSNGSNPVEARLDLNPGGAR